MWKAVKQNYLRLSVSKIKSGMQKLGGTYDNHLQTVGSSYCPSFVILWLEGKKTTDYHIWQIFKIGTVNLFPVQVLFP